jgi:hypothetical protein
MMYRHSRKTNTILARTIATMAAVAVIGAPTATARPILDAPAASQSNANSALVSPTAPTSGQTGSSDFDWGDAGVGAAGALLILGLGSGGIAVRRTRGRNHPATS